VSMVRQHHYVGQVGATASQGCAAAGDDSERSATKKALPCKTFFSYPG